MKDEYLKILRATEIFSSLSEEKLSQLYDVLENVTLHAGDTLFTQGSPSDALYIIISGTLIVRLTLPSGATKIIGIVHRGQTVGEAGLLSTHPRQMTVEALQNAKLLKLSKVSFEAVLSNEITPLIHVINLIISRSQKTIQMLYKSYKHKGYLFLSADIHYDIIPLLHALENENPAQVKFLTVSELLTKQLEPIHLSAYLETLEKKYDTIFYFIDVLNETIIDILTEHSDCLVIIASGNKPIKMHDFSKKMLSNKYQFESVYLALLYADSQPPQYTTDWINLYTFQNVYHIYTKKTKEYRRLLRCLIGNPIGLVLGGGGRRGWVEIGVLKALYEANIEIDYVGGTSIGSFIGALYLQHDTYEQLHKTYTELVAKLKNPLSISNYVYPIISITGGKRSVHIFENWFHDAVIENLPKPYFCISACIQRYSQVVHTKGLLSKWVRASTSIPGILPPVVHNGELYIDGGILNLVPTDVMKDFMGNKGRIIAVDLSRSAKIEKYYFPQIINFWESIFIKLGIIKKYNFPDFYTFLEQAMFLGSTERTLINAKLADILIQPDLTGYSSLFQSKNYEELIELGYDAMKAKISLL